MYDTSLIKHDGPGPHNNGSPQEVHGGGGNTNTKNRDQPAIDAYDGWYESMGYNKNDHAALEAYIGSSYQDINESLRSGFELGEYEDEVRILDDITNWGSAPADMTVYRGMPLYDADSGDPDINQVRSMIEIKKKDPSRRFIFYDNAFLSTTVNRYDAVAFATYEGEDKNPAIFEIEVPKGTKCAAINPSEFEVLFPRETKFEITGVDKNDGFWIVKMKPYAEGK